MSATVEMDRHVSALLKTATYLAQPMRKCHAASVVHASTRTLQPAHQQQAETLYLKLLVKALTSCQIP